MYTLCVWGYTLYMFYKYKIHENDEAIKIRKCALLLLKSNNNNAKKKKIFKCSEELFRWRLIFSNTWRSHIPKHTLASSVYEDWIWVFY